MKSKLQNLIDTLKKTGDETDDDEYTNIAKEIEMVLTQYEDQQSDLKFGEYWLNAVSIGFGRYFDERLVNWREHKQLEEQVINITLLGTNFLNSQTPSFNTRQCGRHEDGACIISPLGPRYCVKSKIAHPAGNLMLTPDQAASFISAPIPILLPKTSIITRVGESESHICTGRWWLYPQLPPSIIAWRSGYAVSKKWNDGKKSADYNLEETIPAWWGFASSQKVTFKDKHGHEIVELCILKGGEAQILLNPDDVPDSLNLRDTNW